MKFETRSVHVGVHKDPQYNSCTTPIYSTSTFYWNDLETTTGFDYTRSGNPTRQALEENLASLEGGVLAAATGTGMSSVVLAMQLFQSGDHIIAPKEVYGGTFRYLYHVCGPQRGLEVSFVDIGNLDEFRAAFKKNTKGVWIETPSNPLLNLVDLAQVAEISQAAGVLTMVDNTFMTPYLQRPFEFGIDLVMHSTTKYLNGHSDTVGGCVIARTEELGEKIAFYQNTLGLGCSPFDAFLVLRGVKTLAPRMKAHQKNAQAIAEMLAEHPQIEHVYYPGLPNHPDHELAQQQQNGFGGMLSFEIKGGRQKAEEFFSRLQFIQLAVSLGGIETLIECPATMSHASMTAEARLAAGITDSLVRLSVGIEHIDDLKNELLNALG